MDCMAALDEAQDVMATYPFTPHKTAPGQRIAPNVVLFTCWLLGWAVGMVFFDRLPAGSPVMLAYLLLMGAVGLWAVLLLAVPHLPQRLHLPEPIEDALPQKLTGHHRAQAAAHCADCAQPVLTGCYYLCRDGDLVPIEDEAVLRVIEESEREMLRRQ